MSEIDLSVIVANYNTRDLLEGCVESIYKATKKIKFEVIVVDDCSPDDSADMIRKKFPDVHLIVNGNNLRYSKTNNKGLDASVGRYALLLNSDVVVQDGAFDSLVQFMDETPEAAAAGPKLLNDDYTVQHCIRSFPGLFPMLLQTLNFHNLFPSNRFTDKYYNTKFDYEKAQVVDSIGTTAFIIRRSTWETYGKLDEKFPLHFVDLAYCYMLRENNQKVYYYPGAEILHYGSATINMSGKKEIGIQHKALRLFYDTYFSKKHSVITRSVVRVGIKFREALRGAMFKYSKNKAVFGGWKIATKNKR